MNDIDQTERERNDAAHFEAAMNTPEDAVRLDTDEPDAGTQARIGEIQDLARTGGLEAPAGAEEIVEALSAALAERDELFAKLQRTVADHQNFQRRAANNEREAGDQARRGVVQSLIPVLDNFGLALGQQNADEGMLSGVRVIRDELLRVLGSFGVSVIDPAPGDEFDPMSHEAMLKQPAEGVDPGCVSANLGVGYKLGERVVRPAKVAVAPAGEG